MTADRTGHSAGSHDRRAGEGRWDPARARVRARPDPAGEPRSAARRHRLSRARELPARAATTVAERIDAAQAARDRARRRRGAGDRLRLHRAAARKPRAAAPTSRPPPIRKARPAGSTSSRASSPTARAASTGSRPAITARSMPRSARARFRCWCATARGSRRSAFAAATRCSTPTRSRALHARERLVDAEDADFERRHCGQRRSRRHSAPNGARRLSRQAPHRRDRRRAPRRLRRRRFLGADARARRRQR